MYFHISKGAPCFKQCIQVVTYFAMHYTSVGPNPIVSTTYILQQLYEWFQDIQDTEATITREITSAKRNRGPWIRVTCQGDPWACLRKQQPRSPREQAE